GNWETEKTVWEAVNTPVLENYTTTQTEIAEKTVSPDSTDSVETVTYLPTSSQTTENKTVSRTIKYVDRDGKEIAPSTTQTVNFTRTVSTNDVTGEKTYGNWETEKTVWEAVNTPVLENYTTTQTEIAEKTVSSDSTDSVETVTYLPTSSQTTENKTVSRTIKYVDRDGKEIAPSTTQTVTFTRTVSTNDVTGEKTYGNWETEKTVWEAVNTPVLE
ncbi:mucin-binding protein, partial [Streptococcus ruminantium]|uniref:mucin-binding protein n=1 Tax=Streptococcus ruminantium TaxID=1917441 RepID=UPI0015AD6417